MQISAKATFLGFVQALDPHTGVLEMAGLKSARAHTGGALAGDPPREIADELVIGWGTVKNHVHSILKKLETNSRHEAAAIYRVHARQGSQMAMAA